MTQRADNTRMCSLGWPVGRAASAFTLVEVLLAIGALAIIAVGLTQVFNATGKTVSAGRRISVMNAYATLVERQMRSDFDAISRDGLMIIRHEEANGGSQVLLDEEDLTGSPRRVDELMFFTTGHFISAREPLYPGYVASSDAARVYYGHGKRMLVPPYNASDPYYQPLLNEGNNQAEATLGYDPGGAVVNPNRYASDWTLLRHVTLLRSPSTTTLPVPTPLPAGLTLGVIPDQDVQVALQPATSFLFRRLAGVIPNSIPTDVIRSDRPGFTSGLVDIATTDLSEIRSMLMTMQVLPNAIGGEADLADPANAPDGDFSIADLDRIRAWMVETLPSGNPLALNPFDRTRIRYEDGPTDLLGAISLPSNATQENFSRSDQLMLQASNFVPHCTEFVVEWSYGVVDPVTLQLLWHGLDRYVDGNLVVDRYPLTPSGASAQHTARYRRSNGAPGTHTVEPTLIYDSNYLTDLIPNRILSTYFGYADPTFTWTNGDPESIPWAWPRLVRVTVGLADPNEPGFEEKFQFVFEVPSSDG